MTVCDICRRDVECFWFGIQARYRHKDDKTPLCELVGKMSGRVLEDVRRVDEARAGVTANVARRGVTLGIGCGVCNSGLMENADGRFHLDGSPECVEGSAAAAAVSGGGGTVSGVGPAAKKITVPPAEIRRYTLNPHDGECGMEEDPQGEYVRFEDLSKSTLAEDTAEYRSFYDLGMKHGQQRAKLMRELEDEVERITSVQLDPPIEDSPANSKVDRSTLPEWIQQNLKENDPSELMPLTLADIQRMFNWPSFQYALPIEKVSKEEADRELRDRFAMAALAGLMDSDMVQHFGGDHKTDSIAQVAYSIADAMLKARDTKHRWVPGEGKGATCSRCGCGEGSSDLPCPGKKARG